MIMIRCVELSRHEFANIKIKILRIYTLIGSECISQQSKPINFVEVRLKIRLGGMNYCSHKLGNICANLPIFGELSQKNIKAVNAEDAAVADAARGVFAVQSAKAITRGGQKQQTPGLFFAMQSDNRESALWDS